MTRRRADADRVLFEDTIRAELEAAGDRGAVASQADKKNYAEALSRRLAERLAACLRPQFDGIRPGPGGVGHESRARSSKGVKRLDVNYSTSELGLGLGVSVKTVNFPDGRSRRYTKNFTRVDAELRAEASDYHERQPWAVMVAVVFLPADACDDAGRASPSSFGRAVQLFRFRAGRGDPGGPAPLFERLFVGLYEAGAGDGFGRVGFFDVADAPPRAGRPARLFGFHELAARIVATYDARNSPVFEWADAAPEVLTGPPVDPGASGDDDDDGEA